MIRIEYVTEDGARHESEQAAQAHERLYEKASWLADQLWSGHGTTENGIRKDVLALLKSGKIQVHHNRF